MKKRSDIALALISAVLINVGLAKMSDRFDRLARPVPAPKPEGAIIALAPCVSCNDDDPTGVS